MPREWRRNGRGSLGVEDVEDEGGGVRIEGTAQAAVASAPRGPRRNAARASRAPQRRRRSRRPLPVLSPAPRPERNALAATRAGGARRRAPSRPPRAASARRTRRGCRGCGCAPSTRRGAARPRSRALRAPRRRAGGSACWRAVSSGARSSRAAPARPPAPPRSCARSRRMWSSGRSPVLLDAHRRGGPARRRAASADGHRPGSRRQPSRASRAFEQPAWQRRSPRGLRAPRTSQQGEPTASAAGIPVSRSAASFQRLDDEVSPKLKTASPLRIEGGCSCPHSRRSREGAGIARKPRSATSGIRRRPHYVAKGKGRRSEAPLPDSRPLASWAGGAASLRPARMWLVGSRSPVEQWSGASGRRSVHLVASSIAGPLPGRMVEFDSLRESRGLPRGFLSMFAHMPRLRQWSHDDMSRQTRRDRPARAPRSCALLDAWWRAANYLSVGQIYLLDNPLLREPLERRPREAAPARPLRDDTRA